MGTVISKALTADNFDYDMTDGFRMGVEKQWHKIAPLAPLKTTDIYDLNGNKLDATNYGISIWIKAVVPLSHFDDSGVTENDCKIFDNGDRMTLLKGTPLGTPVTMTGATSSYARDIVQLDMLRTGLPTAYAKPTQLNTTGIPNTAFADGRNNCLATTALKIDNKEYKIIDNPFNTYLVGTNDDVNNKSLVPSCFISNGTLSYTIETANLLLNQSNTNIRYVIPELFTMFGQVGSNKNNYINERPCWFLLCLGVDTVQ